MTLEQLAKQNEKFRSSASQISELLPGSNLHSFATSLIRSSKKLDTLLVKVLQAKTEMSFYKQIDVFEEEIDELVYLIDRLEEANRLMNMTMITDVIKGGYDIISLFSRCCDQILERKTKNQDEFK